MAYANGQYPESALAPALGFKLAPAPAHDLLAFAAAFQAKFGKPLTIGSGYRPLGSKSDAPTGAGTTQWGSWNYYKLKGSPIAATPGTSNHGTGHAADLHSGIDIFGTPEHAWAVANAPTYGWSWGAVKSEPWHFEHLSDTIKYTGKVAAPAAAAPAKTAGRATIKRGSKGADVTYLQQRLNAHGSKLTIDGDFGPATDTAVRQFQTANKLTVDGIVGANTWAKLG